MSIWQSEQGALAASVAVAQHEAKADPHPQYERRVKNNLTATAAPAVTDDADAGYEPRSIWFNTAQEEVYRCISADIGAAVWAKTTLTIDELGSAAIADAGDFDPGGAAAQAVTDHEELENPHAQYLQDAQQDGKIYSRQNGAWVAPYSLPENSVIGVALRATGGPGGTWDHIDIDGNTITAPSASYFNYHPIFGGMVDVMVDGQYMVEVPKFYYKRGTAGGDPAWWISPQPLAGFAVMPAFVLDGVEVESFQYGKYQASESGGKLQSIPGVLPKVSTSLTDFLSLATARNVGDVAGFRLHHYDMWLAIQWLYLVETATMDSQTAAGQGRVSESSAAVVDAADVAQATYRGIVGLWGNIRQWIDGARTLSGVIERRDYNGAWESTGESVPNAGNATYPITFRASSPQAFIPDTYATSNDSTATLPDYVRWRGAGEYYPDVGGRWSNGANAGLWYVNCFNSASNSSTHIGARLARVAS